MPVDDRHPEYSNIRPDWKRCRDAAKGQRAIHAATEEYLSRLDKQDDAGYEAYLSRATFYEATTRTVEGLGGMIFRKKPAIEENGMTDFLEDVTMSGTDINGFAQDLVKNVLEVGRAGILVDHPTMEQVIDEETGEPVPLSQAQVEAANLRPFLKEYTAESIINWRISRVNNKSQLSEVRLDEYVEEQDPEDEFSVYSIHQIRVLELNELGQYQQRIFREKTTANNKSKAQWEQYGETIIPTRDGSPLDFIPFIFVKTDSTSPKVDEPPLMGLVNINISHYKTTADLEHGAHFTGLPTAVITGHAKGDEDVFQIGSTSAWVFSDADADAKYLEFEGKGLDTLKEMLESKESKMAAMGAQMLTPDTRRNEAAETAEIRHNGENSVLSSISMTISEALNMALDYAAQWMNVEAATITLNTDFMAKMLNPQMIQALLLAYQQGTISKQTLFENFKRGELVDTEKSFEDEQSEIENNDPFEGEGDEE